MELAIQVAGDLANQFAAFSDDHARLFCINRDLRAHRRAVHDHAAVSGPLQLYSQVLIDESFGDALCYELLLYGHQLFTSVKIISTETVSVFLGVARPMARGIHPRMVLPL